MSQGRSRVERGGRKTTSRPLKARVGQEQKEALSTLMGFDKTVTCTSYSSRGYKCNTLDTDTDREVSSSLDFLEDPI